MKISTLFHSKRKEYLIYGISMALVLFLLKMLEAHFIVFNYRLDLFIGAIAIVFTVLGIWIALKLVNPKVVTRIVEKEIYLEKPVSTEINHDEIARLGLSRREMEVLTLMGKGWSNEEIAEKLFISLNTVKTHASNIFMKLDVKRRTMAVEKAKQMHIIK